MEWEISGPKPLSTIVAHPTKIIMCALFKNKAKDEK